MKILEGITEDTEIEAEVLQTEEINSSISNTRAKIVQCLKPTTPAVVASLRTTSPSVPVHEHFIRLGSTSLYREPLHWQSFWDYFTAAVDNNPSLTGVQKLSYLRAQLSGDAAHVITGFQLTNNNMHTLLPY